MQNDYQLLYNVVREKVGGLENSWKLTVLSMKSSQESKNHVYKSESFSNTARRINPTLLKAEPMKIDGGNNPFTSDNSTEFPLNRPMRKSNSEPETAWKKVSSPVVARVITEQDVKSTKYALSDLFKSFNSQCEVQDNLKKLSTAYFQIVFDQVSVDFGSFAEAFGIILRMLAVGHELFCLTSFYSTISEEFLSKPLSSSGDPHILLTPLEILLFSIYWVKEARKEISRLFPDVLKSFIKNAMLDCMDPDTVQFFKHSSSNNKEDAIAASSTSSGNLNIFSSSSLHSLLPVAYSNQRDSKNFLRDPTSHSNQQKIRDLFINLVRHFSTNQLDTSQPSFHRSFTSRVSELISKVNFENYAWLADLYLQEYEQAADVRLDRLEERMSSSKRLGNTTFSLDQIFFLFLKYADSFRLTRAVEKKVIAVISVSIDQANNPHKRASWSDSVRKMRSIIKLLGFCRYKMVESEGCLDESDISVEEEDVLIFSWTQDSVVSKQLLTMLPLIHDYFVFIGPEAVRSRCSNTVKLLLRYYQVKFEKRKRRHSTSPSRSKLFLRLGLEDIFRETLSQDFYSDCVMSLKAECTDECDEEDEKRISRSHHEGGMKKTTRPSCLDEDEQLPPFVSTIYRSISGQIRHVYVQLNSICMNMAQNHFESSGHIAANSESTLTPRKVRPITQVPAADLKQQRIQKQLRQWFWWRYGSEKDLIDALNSYILEQLLLPQFPVMTTDRNQSVLMCFQMYRELIYKTLPDLMPPFWKEHPEMIEMILGLTLEMSEKIIKSHFS